MLRFLSPSAYPESHRHFFNAVTRTLCDVLVAAPPPWDLRKLTRAALAGANFLRSYSLASYPIRSGAHLARRRLGDIAPPAWLCGPWPTIHAGLRPPGGSDLFGGFRRRVRLPIQGDFLPPRSAVLPPTRRDRRGGQGPNRDFRHRPKRGHAPQRNPNSGSVISQVIDSWESIPLEAPGPPGIRTRPDDTDGPSSTAAILRESSVQLIHQSGKLLIR